MTRLIPSTCTLRSSEKQRGQQAMLSCRFRAGISHLLSSAGTLHVTWAATCSRPRIGEFNGGAVFVTATEIIWNGVFSWLSKRIAEFDQHREPPLS